MTAWFFYFFFSFFSMPCVLSINDTERKGNRETGISKEAKRSPHVSLSMIDSLSFPWLLNVFWALEFSIIFHIATIFFQVLVHVYLQKSCRIFVYLFIHQVIQLGSATTLIYPLCYAMFCQNQSYKCEISVLKIYTIPIGFGKQLGCKRSIFFGHQTWLN